MSLLAFLKPFRSKSDTSPPDLQPAREIPKSPDLSDTPRIFISYRHNTGPDGTADRAADIEHRAWVSELVDVFEQLKFDVVWDKKVATYLSKKSSIPISELPFAAEISRIMPLISDVFIPVLDDSYLQRAALDYTHNDGKLRGGGVYEEWQGAMHWIREGQMDIIIVSRSPKATAWNDSNGGFPIEEFTYPSEENIPDKICRMANFISREGRRQSYLRNVGYKEWIDLYIDWCALTYSEYSNLPIEVWSWRSDRPVDFLNAIFEVLNELQIGKAELSIKMMRDNILNPRIEKVTLGWEHIVGSALKDFRRGGVGIDRLRMAAKAYKASEEPQGGNEKINLGERIAYADSLTLIGQADGCADLLKDAIGIYIDTMEKSKNCETDGDWARAGYGLGKAVVASIVLNGAPPIEDRHVLELAVTALKRAVNMQPKAASETEREHMGTLIVEIERNLS